TPEEELNTPPGKEGKRQVCGVPHVRVVDLVLFSCPEHLINNLNVSGNRRRFRGILTEGSRFIRIRVSQIELGTIGIQRTRKVKNETFRVIVRVGIQFRRGGVFPVIKGKRRGYSPPVDLPLCTLKCHTYSSSVSE